MSRHKTAQWIDVPPMSAELEDPFQDSWGGLAAVFRPDDPHVDQADPGWCWDMATMLGDVSSAAERIRLVLPPRSVWCRSMFATHIWANEKSTEYELRAQSLVD